MGKKSTKTIKMTLDEYNQDLELARGAGVQAGIQQMVSVVKDIMHNDGKNLKLEGSDSAFLEFIDELKSLVISSEGASTEEGA